MLRTILLRGFQAVVTPFSFPFVEPFIIYLTLVVNKAIEKAHPELALVIRVLGTFYV